MFIRFRRGTAEQSKVLNTLFDKVKEIKENTSTETTIIQQSWLWEHLPFERKAYFIWDTTQLKDGQNTDTLPSIAFDDEQWNTQDILEGLCTGDVQLDCIADIDDEYQEFRFKDAGESYDGLDAYLDILIALNFEIVGYNDFGDYIEFMLT